MIEYIESRPEQFIPRSVSLADYPGEFSVIDEERLASVQVSKPVILAEIAPGRFNMIDGNHRAEKARRDGIQNITAYKLHPEDHAQFLTDKEGYVAYVGYWNEKVMDGVLG